jgi:hypothetical protein
LEELEKKNKEAAKIAEEYLSTSKEMKKASDL